ncbi:MAG: HNH endonuclease [Promicromonosporaceae bacterium]|nr:HNH endonuclease [Promicromonosporaceae bacterium]
MENGGPRAWLLMAAGDDRSHGGNTGYDDQVDAYYSYDSEVQNYRNIRVGDVVALWDKARLLGVSVIEEIESWQGPKLQNRCPNCNETRINERSTKALRWRCQDCKHEFPAPVGQVIEATHFRVRYDAAWTSLTGLLVKEEIKSLQIKPGSFNSIRQLDWSAFSEALIAKNADRAVLRVASRTPAAVDWNQLPGLHVDIPQGFRHALVRVRRGQAQFRERLLLSQGSLCAFTGGAPPRALEAGHLYSYAAFGEHHEHGGLMLRRDIHRLFDDGLLAVQPSNLHIDVSPELEPYPQYARLHEMPLTIELHDNQVDWLGRHWDEHRIAPRALA